MKIAQTASALLGVRLLQTDCRSVLLITFGALPFDGLEQKVHVFGALAFKGAAESRE